MADSRRKQDYRKREVEERYLQILYVNTEDEILIFYVISYT